MDLNAADGFTLGFFKQVEVDFCRCNMLMREHFTYGVNIGPACQLKHGVGVPETLKSMLHRTRAKLLTYLEKEGVL